MNPFFYPISSTISIYNANKKTQLQIPILQKLLFFQRCQVPFQERITFDHYNTRGIAYVFVHICFNCEFFFLNK